MYTPDMEEKKEKFTLTTFAKVLIAVALVGVVVLAQFFLWPWIGISFEREMIISGTGRVLTYDFDSGAAFHSNDSRFFHFATRDGIRFLGSNEILVWSESFSFNHPWLSGRGDFVAVGEVSGGRTIHVFDENGRVFYVVLDNPILAFWVNETGFLSVIAQYDRGYGVYVFNRYRTTAADPLFAWTVFDELIIPTHADVSADGRYIAIGVKDLTIDVRHSVQFRYINQWDAWGTDRGHFATEEFTGELFTALRFMNDNRLIVATTSQIVGFQLGPGHAASRPIWQISLENEKTHMDFYNGTHFAFAVGARLPMVTEEGAAPGTVRIFGANGIETGTFELGRRATHLRMGHNSVIVGGDRSFHAINFRGTPLWEHTTLFDTRDVLFLDNTNTILVAGSNRAEIFERRRLRDADFIEEEPDETDEIGVPVPLPDPEPEPEE